MKRTLWKRAVSMALALMILALPVTAMAADFTLIRLEATDVELDAVRVGPIGFATAPIEMFDTNGLQIKAGSPFETTFVLTMANGMVPGYYVPSQDTWEYKTADGSLPYEVGYCHFVKGTGEMFANELVGMLNGLNG